MVFMFFWTIWTILCFAFHATSSAGLFLFIKKGLTAHHSPFATTMTAIFQVLLFPNLIHSCTYFSTLNVEL